VSTGVKYDMFVIGSDEDLQVLFHCHRSFPEIRTHELYAKLEDGVDSSRASAPNPQLTALGGASSLMHVVALARLFVASPSFVVDLNHTDEYGSRALENHLFR